MVKMQTLLGKWVIEDGGVNKIFDTSFEAWCYVFLMKEIRPRVPNVPRTLYPVKSLEPGSEMSKKKIITRSHMVLNQKQ